MNVKHPPCSRTVAAGRTSNTCLGIAFAKPDRILNDDVASLLNSNFQFITSKETEVRDQMSDVRKPATSNQ